MTDMFGVFALSVACIGWLFDRLSVLERCTALGASLLMIQPNWITDGLGFLTFGLLALYIYKRPKRPKKATSPETA